MSTFKKISLTVNAESGAFIDPADGSKLSTACLPDFCLGETSILCLSFVDSDLNAYPFETNDSFELSIDKDFVHTVSGVEDPLMAYSANSMFNISGDWDSASLAAGKISVRINCNTTGFVSKIGFSESVMAWLEIKRYPAGLSDASIILRNKCVTRNSVKITEGEPSSASPDYYTALQINTLMVAAEEAADAKYALQSNVLELDNTTAFTPTGDYQPATKKYVDDNAGGSSGEGIGANLLINADFRINQRSYTSGSATTAANQFTFDRWFIPTSGQNLTFSSNKNGKIVTAPASGIVQVVEGVNIEGGTYTLSWTGTATATVNGTSVSKGGTLTLTAGSNCVVKFSSGTVYGAKLELGSTATSFISDLYDSEFKKCQRYYQKLGFVHSSIAHYGYQASGNGIYITLTFPSMRAAPTGAISGTWTYGNCTAPGVCATSISSLTINCAASSSGTVYFQCGSTSGITLSSEITS